MVSTPPSGRLSYSDGFSYLGLVVASEGILDVDGPIWRATSADLERYRESGGSPFTSLFLDEF